MKKYQLINRLIALLAIIVGFVSSAFAAPSSQTVTLRFDESMFKIAANGNRIESIRYLNGASSLPADTCLPALPVVSVIVGGPAGSVCDFRYQIKEKHLIFEDVQLPLAPKIVSSAELHRAVAPSAPRLYSGSTYPAEVCTYRTRSPWADATDFHFGCSPIVYDAASRSLYLIDELDLTLTYSDAPASKFSAATAHTLTPRPSFLSAPLGSNYNRRDSLKRPFVPIDSPIVVIKPDFPIGPAEEIETHRNEYVIITSEALKPAFEKLAQWKQIKGIDPLIQTVEYIEQHVEGKDTPAKIKNYLRSVRRVGLEDKDVNPIKYVLLGGGADIIPPRYCFGDQSVRVYQGNDIYKNLCDTIIPADLYFACLNDPYDWDMNGNGVYGEDADSICMNPSFAITRVPVESLQDAENYVNKAIEYEHFPKWTQNVLLGGLAMSNEPTLEKAKSLAWLIAPQFDIFTNDGTKVYNKSKKFLFDQYNSFNFTGNQDNLFFTKPNLSSALKIGFTIVEIMTHGGQEGWQTNLDIQGHKDYNTDDAINEISPNHSLIVSMVACHTSAFDRPNYPNWASLGEGFIAGRNNGVIAYLGSSRSGYFFEGTDEVFSIAYERKFYERLYSSPLNKNFGSIITDAKYTLSETWRGPKNAYRWLQYSINPFGDPEMPIFTDEPLNFSDVTVEIDSTTVKINANEPGSRICVVGVGEKNSYLRRTGTNTLTAKSLPNMFSICITKQDFKPWHRVYQRLADGSIASLDVETLDQYFSENMGLQKESKGTIKKVYAGINGFNVTTSTNPVNSAKIEIIPMEFSGRIPPSAVVVEIEPGLNITTEIPYSLTMQNGIYQIRLKVDGKLQDHVSVLKQ